MSEPIGIVSLKGFLPTCKGELDLKSETDGTILANSFHREINSVIGKVEAIDLKIESIQTINTDVGYIISIWQLPIEMITSYPKSAFYTSKNVGLKVAIRGVLYGIDSDGNTKTGSSEDFSAYIKGDVVIIECKHTGLGLLNATFKGMYITGIDFECGYEADAL